MKGEDAVNLIAQQAQNVQEDGSVSDLQTPRAAYDSAVRNFNKELVDAAIEANPLLPFPWRTVSTAMAFNNSLQAGIISRIRSGKIISANCSACILLGYPKKELLAKRRAAIFDINKSCFKKMQGQKMADGYSKAFVTAIKKNGSSFPCDVTSAVFTDESGIENIIFIIDDMS